MLEKVPKIKDFYIVFLCINTIVSTCTVPGNISQHLPLPITYPPSAKYLKSLANVAESQLT